MKHSASDVARWFLWRNDAEMRTGDSEYISNLKLQKLLCLRSRQLKKEESHNHISKSV